LRRIVFSALFILTALGILSGIPAAASGREFSGGYTDVFPTFQALTEKLTNTVADLADPWSFYGDIGRTDKETDPETLKEYLSINVSDKQEGFVTFSYDQALDIHAYNGLTFGLCIVPDGSAADDTAYRVALQVGDGQDTVKAYVYVTPGKWTQLCFDISKLSVGEGHVSSLIIRVEYAGKPIPEKIQLTPPALQQYNTKLLDAFSTDSLTTAFGSYIPASGQFILRPDNGRLILSCSYLMDTLAVEAKSLLLAVTLEGTAAAGTLSVEALYDGQTETLRTEHVELHEGSYTYLLPLPIPDTVSEISAADLVSYHLNFRGMEAQDNRNILLTNVTLYTIAAEPAGDRPIPQAEELGTVLTFGIIDKEIVISGKLTRDTVIRYINDVIALYAVPAWNAGSLDEAVCLGEFSVSNDYTFNLPLSSYRMYAESWLFFLTIEQRDTEHPENTVMHVISEPRYLNGSAPADATVSVLGLHNTNSVGVFESNVSHVIMDVLLNKMFTEDNGIVCTRNGQSWNLDAAYIAALDKEIQFYTDAGLEVCLRICGDAPVSGLTAAEKTAHCYLPYTAEKEAVIQYTAVLSFLCSRYPAVSSIALGSGINSEKYTGFPLEDPADALNAIAELAALTYSTAAAVIPDVYLVVPFTDNTIYASELSSNSSIILPQEFTAVMFAQCLDRLGNIPWVISCSFEAYTALPAAESLIDSISHILPQLELVPPADVLYIWRPDGSRTQSYAS